MKNTVKRLFLFASYNKDNIISDELLSYLKELSTLGDIIFFMDNPISEEENYKLKLIKNILFTCCKKHGEYDFGSYKRAFIYAEKNKILTKYDWIYFVNDSVYMLNSPEKIIKDLEHRKADMIGMYSYKNLSTPIHIQSWFFGVNKKLGTSDVFKHIIHNIEKQQNKEDIIYKYEVGITQTIIKHGYKISSWLNSDKIDDIRWRPLTALEAGIPFLKKAAIDQIDNMRYLLPYTDNYKLVDKLKKHKNKDYITIFKISFLILPIFSIKKSKRGNEYKFYLLDIIPLIKIKKS